MKKYLQIVFFTLIITNAYSQDFAGLWKGRFQENFLGSNQYTDINLLFIPLTDTTFEAYSYTMFPYSPKDTILCKLKGYMPSKEYLVLEEIKAVNVVGSIDSCMYQRMNLNLRIRKKYMTLYGKWATASTCKSEDKGGSIEFRKKMK